MTIDFEAKRVWASRRIEATADKIFEVLTDASLHPVIDGSDSVKGARGDRDHRLTMGSRFGMNMRLGIPYMITNEVVEFEPNRLIAWRHVGRHRWRFELQPTDDGATRVTETFDWSTSLWPKALELLGYPAKHEVNIERTLEQLDAFLTHRSDAL